MFNYLLIIYLFIYIKINCIQGIINEKNNLKRNLTLSIIPPKCILQIIENRNRNRKQKIFDRWLSINPINRKYIEKISISINNGISSISSNLNPVIRENDSDINDLEWYGNKTKFIASLFYAKEILKKYIQLNEMDDIYSELHQNLLVATYSYLINKPLIQITVQDISNAARQAMKYDFIKKKYFNTMSSLQIVSYEKIKLERMKDLTKENLCSFCLEEFENDQDVYILSCNHYFHLTCLDNWIDTFKFNCPNCRKDISTIQLNES